MSATVKDPDAAKANDALSHLLSHVDPQTTTPALAYHSNEFKSLEQAFTHLGISFSSISGGIKAKLDSETYSAKNNLVIDFVQRYYTVCCFNESPGEIRGGFHLTVGAVRRACLKVSTRPAYRRSIRYKRIAMREFQSFSERFGCSGRASTLSVNACIFTTLHDLFQTSV